MRFSRLSLVVLVVILLNAITAFAGDFEIKFGLMKKDSGGKYYVYSETTAIPLTYKDTDPDFRFGYSIKTASGQSFTTYFIMYSPAAFESYTGEFKDAAKKEGGKTVQSSSKKTTGWFTQSFRFDRGDPPGPYAIDIWINDKLAKTIEFTVTEAK